MVAIALSPEQVLEWLSDVADPEIPVLTIADLGIIRGVRVEDEVIVELTPTYSGCPATEVIEKSVVDALYKQGIENVRIERVLSPAWTTDWISEEGRKKLREYGIAPPAEGGSKRELLHGSRSIACPRCDSTDTSVVSEFGSTACKASYKCNSCLEPFEYFKCI
ncbi:MAG: phenylacetate-CoA oxygenase subunit PaaJ [Woeseiaceae bacterium]